MDLTASQVGPTAQAVYADMVRTEIAPRLHALGFKGSGSSFVLPDDDRWLIVAFQKNYYSRKDCVRFTVNLTVANKRDWAEARAEMPSLPLRPSGKAHYMEAEMAVIRLGNLMPPDGQDRWWQVGPQRPGGAPAKRILKAIERLAIPWFQTGAARWPDMVRGY